jgi:hypothetical protein
MAQQGAHVPRDRIRINGRTPACGLQCLYRPKPDDHDRGCNIGQPVRGGQPGAQGHALPRAVDGQGARKAPVAVMQLAVAEQQNRAPSDRGALGHARAADQGRGGAFDAQLPCRETDDQQDRGECGGQGRAAGHGRRSITDGSAVCSLRSTMILIVTSGRVASTTLIST